MQSTPPPPADRHRSGPSSRPTPEHPVSIDVKAPELLLRRQAGARRHLDRHPAQPRHRLHRPVRLRQEHVPADAQPHERHHRRHPRRGPGAHRRRRHLRRADRRRGAAPPGRDGVPEVEPVPQVDLRERRLRHPVERPGRDALGAAAAGSRRASRPRRSGTRSRTGCTTRRWRCRAASSSGCASRGRWP